MANSFSGDGNCVALWRFENGALTADSIGTNTLTDNNTVGTSTGDYKEGSACADLELDNSECFSESREIPLKVPLTAGFTISFKALFNESTICFSITI